MFLDLAEIRAILLAKEFETLTLTGKYSSYPILKRNMQINMVSKCSRNIKNLCSHYQN